MGVVWVSRGVCWGCGEIDGCGWISIGVEVFGFGYLLAGFDHGIWWIVEKMMSEC